LHAPELCAEVCLAQLREVPLDAALRLSVALAGPRGPLQTCRLREVLHAARSGPPCCLLTRLSPTPTPPRRAGWLSSGPGRRTRTRTVTGDDIALEVELARGSHARAVAAVKAATAAAAANGQAKVRRRCRALRWPRCSQLGRMQAQARGRLATCRRV
jgi:hypothetical protein